MPRPNYHNVIYIMTNRAFERWVKIGYASDLNRRLQELNSSTAVPYAFDVYAVYEVNDRLTDTKVHELIDELNPELRARDNVDGHERRREFFDMTPEAAYRLLECIAIISSTRDRLHRIAAPVTPEPSGALRHRTNILPRFRFSMCNLAPGAVIEYVDDPSIKARVVDDIHIEYQGRVTSMSALAKSIRGVECAGPMCFSYNGEILSQMRRRLETDNHTDE